MNDTAKTETPDFQPWVDIELSRPASINGVKTKVVRMNEPTVANQRAAQSRKGEAFEKEIAYFCDLIGCAPDDIAALPMKDYKRLEQAFYGFFD